MAEVMTEYADPIIAADGSRWSARACARPFAGHSEGWIEFVPLSAGYRPLRTPTETTQPSREAVAYWASGITPTYLEGALERARTRPTVVEKESATSVFEAPAPTVLPGAVPIAPKPLLDPYAVHAQGEHILVAELAALGIDHLRAIALAYDLPTPAAATRTELTDTILASARAREVPSS